MKKIFSVIFLLIFLTVPLDNFAYGQEKAEPESQSTPQKEPAATPSIDILEKINPEDAKTKSKKESDALTAQSAQVISEPQPLPSMDSPKSDPWLNLKGFQDLFVSNLFSGEARLDIPFVLPPGRRALSPEVILTYSSFKKDYISPFGYGFDLSTSSIFRNTAHGLDQLYTRNDFAVKFAGKYNELVLVDAATNLYKGKSGNDFNKYFLENNQWRVQDTQGNLFYFGVDSLSRQTDPDDASHIYQWMITKVIDLNGNTIEYTYFQDRNQVYLDTIRYVFTSPTESLFRIKFNYLSKSTSATSYHPGFPVSTYSLLQSIDAQENVSSAFVTKKRYIFAYDNINNSVSRLISITQDAGGQTFPPIQFEYYSSGLATGLLSKVLNNTGGEMRMEYLSSTVYRDGTGKQNFLPFIVKTLSKLTYADLVRGINLTKGFTYHGGHYFYDPGEVFTREYAGFHEVITVDSIGTTTKTYFHQSQFDSGNAQSVLKGEFDDHISKKGRVYREEVYDLSGKLFLSTVTKWGKVDLGNDRFFVSLDRETKLSWDGDSSHRDTGEEFLYDQYGNITKDIKWGEVTGNVNTGEFTDIGTDKITTQISYALNAAQNILTFPSTQTVYGQDGITKVQETKSYYDVLAIGQIAKGNLTKEEGWVSSVTYINTQQTYNSYGLVTQSQDPRGNKTTYAYDSFNLYPISVTNAKNQITTFTYDYFLGKIKTTKDPNSRVFETVYDPFGRVKEEREPDLATPSLLATKSAVIYTDTVTPRKTQTTHFLDATNSFDVFTYFDGFGRKIQERKEGESANNFVVKDFTYNEIGLPSKESLPYFATGSAYTSPTTNNSLYTSYTYDALSRVKTTANVLGTTANTYSDWKTTVVDAEDNKKDLIKDAHGRSVKINEFNGASTYVTTYEYNSLDKLTKIIDSKGNIRNFTYDALGRRLTAQDLHSPSDTTYGTTAYTYDSAGNITKTVDPKSQVVDQTYDTLNRSLTENYTGAAGTEITYVYDSGVNGIGRLTSAVASAAATTNYVYNAVGNISTETKTISSVNYVTKYENDRQGNIALITYPDNSQVKYTYNNAGLLEKVSGKESGVTTFTDVVTNIDYSPIGKIAFKNFANGVKTTYTYDSNKLYRLTNITTAGTSNFQNISYTYDKIGNITQILDSSANNAAKTANYTYDDLYRLVSATVSGAANGQNYTQNYTYDSIGNITNKSDIGNYLYQGNTGTSYANPHAATSVNGVISNFDRNGNLTSDGTRTNTWNYRNRILRIVKSSKTYTYKYDHNNDRVGIADSLGTRVYPNRLYNIQGTSKTKHIFAGDELIATVDTLLGVTSVFYDHTDHLGGSSVLTNATGVKQQLLDYYPFGGIRLNEKVSTFDEQRKFTGQEYDATTNLHYFIQRYYNQDIGRFMSQDSVFLAVGGPKLENKTGQELQRYLSDPQNMNSYSYARNNPLAYRDPDGEFGVLALMGIGAAVGIAAQGIEDWTSRDLSPWQDYAGAAAGGAMASFTAGGLAAAGILPGSHISNGIVGGVNSAVSEAISQSLKVITGDLPQHDWSKVRSKTAGGIAINAVVPAPGLPGFNQGIDKGIVTSLARNHIQNFTMQTATKIFTNQFIDSAVSAIGKGIVQNQGIQSQFLSIQSQLNDIAKQINALQQSIQHR